MVMIGTFANTRIRVLDEEDGTPLAASTVFSKSGVIIGITDNDGFITVTNDRDFPITVRCVGYQPFTATKGMEEIKLSPASFTLNEIIATPVDRPIYRVVCYIREYLSGATGTDTLMCFNEHMADFFILRRDKVKGFKAHTHPRFLTSKLYTRKTDSSGLDSIYSPKHRDESISWESFLTYPTWILPETDPIKNGARIDSVPGKYGVKQLLRKNSDSSFYTQIDYLADTKDHKLSPFIFKLLGMTVDLTELKDSWAFQPSDKGYYTPADIVSGIFSISVLGKGKWIKKAFKSDSPVLMNNVYEIYPIEFEPLTVEEAKAYLKEKPKTKMTVSQNATPLSPAIQKLIDACSN